MQPTAQAVGKEEIRTSPEGAKENARNKKPGAYTPGH
jgi:hypothetical protein